MTKVETNTGAVWINPAHVVWFWDYHGDCHVTLSGRDDTMVLEGVSAQFFADLVADRDDVPF